MNVPSYREGSNDALGYVMAGMKGSSSRIHPFCRQNFRFLIPFLLCVWIGLAGCVMVPIPIGEGKLLAGKLVSEEQLSFLAPGVTEAQEVVERLGNPVVIWEEARVFVYNWKMRQGILFWAIGGASQGAMAGGAGMTDIPKHYLLLIRFDEQEWVRYFERAVCPLNTPYSEFLKEWVRNTTAIPPRSSPGPVE
jgi:outer membrane protein assembly factor BamE (lipoprotein component of BamABCDE complex)